MSPLVLLAVALAGGLGAVARHLLATAVGADPRGPGRGIVVVNVIGSFLAGWASTLAPAAWVSVVAVGLLGGFTTFSTAAVDSLAHARRHPVRGAVHAVGMLLLCCLAAWGGRQLG